MRTVIVTGGAGGIGLATEPRLDRRSDEVLLRCPQLRGVERRRDRADDGPCCPTCRENVRVNCVAPGIFRTPMASAYTDEQWAGLQPTIPMGRVGEPSEVANVIVSLLSDEWSYVTGQCINVNGGQFML
jgi:NAD(P)-dependent dehydrogenase (short-subunit alcohol dehydrogenase family)